MKQNKERHAALPQKKTVEELALWLTENAIDKRVHTEEVKLTDEDVHLYENKITKATAAIYNLAEIKKAFETTLKKGTTVLKDTKGEPQRQPETFTIPPTKGTEELEENRKHADKILKQGFTTIDTELFAIPYPEKKQVVFFDVEGTEFYNEPMTEEQERTFTTLFDATKPLRDTVKDMQKNGVKVSAKGPDDEEFTELFPESDISPLEPQ